MPLTVTDIDVSDDIEGGMLPGPAHPVKCLTDGVRYIQEVSELALATRVDEVSTTLMYVGSALPGTLTSAPYWQISRVNTSAGVIVEYADGDTAYDNIWDNRASLIYA